MELALLGPLVLGVLVQVIVLFGVLHRATLATSAAAREYGRAVVLARSAPEAQARGAVVVEQAARDHGLPPGSLHSTVEGDRIRGATLHVAVRTSVPVLHVPFLGPLWPALAIPVEATHAVRLDRYATAR